jgi:two-component system response regulator DegU
MQHERGKLSLMKTVIVDDHPVVRKGLRLLMECEPSVEVVGEASDGPSALAAVYALRPDLLLLDINMPEMSGLDVLRQLRNELNFIPVIILSNHSDTRYVDAALAMGANGYVGKDSGFDILMLAIEAVRDGVPFIDPKIPRRAA